MQTDPNPKVRMMQVILVIMFIVTIGLFFVHTLAGFVMAIGCIIFNNEINNIKKTDGFNKQRKQMGII